MNIVTIGATYGGGGPGSTAMHIHRELMKCNENSKVLCAIKYEDDENVLEIYNKFELVLFRIFRKLNIRFPLLKKYVTYKMVRNMIGLSPDIVHIRVIHHDYFDYEYLFKSLGEMDSSIIVTLHDMWLMTGGCYHFIDYKCEKYQNLCTDCPKPDRYLDNPSKCVQNNFKKKRDLISRFKDLTIISVSNWVLECSKKSFLKKYTQRVIYNAVDLDVFYPRKRNDNDKYIIIGVANTWSDSKGLKDFYELAKILPDNYIIYLIGNVPHVEENSLKIKLLGHIHSKDELATLYTNADVFLHLSHQETFGMVIAEAACCGIMTIGYNVSAIPEVIRMARGIIVEEYDVDSVKKSVINVCESKKRIEGKELEDVRRAFSKERMVDEHVSLYREIMQSF